MLFVAHHAQKIIPVRMARLLLLLSSLIFLLGCSAEAPKEIPWQDQIIYFLMTDRFADGDSTNNDQGAGEYDTRDRKSVV